MTDVTFTERELQVMTVLWAQGSATVAEVRERLADDLAYTTVLTMLRTLEDKGHVRHVEEGRAHRYLPTVAEAEARKSALKRVVGRVFGGSPAAVMAHLVADERLTPQDLERIRALLDARLKHDEEGS